MDNKLKERVVKEMVDLNVCLDAGEYLDRIDRLDRIYGYIAQLSLMGYDIDIDGDGVDGYEAVYFSYGEETQVVFINGRF